MLLRRWAEFKDGPVTFGPYPAAFMQLSHKRAPPYSSEWGEIHHDDVKGNPNSWIIPVLFLALSAPLATCCFVEHYSHHLQQKRRRNKCGETPATEISHQSGSPVERGEDTGII